MKMLFILKQAVRMLRRDWNAGELNILAIGILIAVTSITAAGFFIDRVEKGLKQQSAELIGADLLVSSSQNDLDRYKREAKARGLLTANTTEFRSVVPAKDRVQLVEVKAVTDGYPLSGKLKISDTTPGSGHTTNDIPHQGNVWVNASLLQLLNIHLGAVIHLGDGRFVVKRILSYEPDRGGDLFSVAPRVLMNSKDLAKTHLIQTGALVKYHLLVNGTPDQIQNFRSYLKKKLQPGQRIIDVQNGRPELKTAFNNSRRFLALAVIISVLLSGVAIVTVANRFSQRHFDTSAILRCFGVGQRTVTLIFSMEMLIFSFLVSTIGIVIGYVFQLGITRILDRIILAHLPAADFKSVLVGYGSSIILLIGFVLPPLLALGKVPLLRILRKDIVFRTGNSWLVYISALFCVAALLLWQVRDIKLMMLMMTGLLITVLVLAFFAYLLTGQLKRMRGQVGTSWRFGLLNLVRHSKQTILQIVVFGLVVMILLLISIVRSDLLKDWQQDIPIDAPNYFIINVQSNQLKTVTQFFSSRNVAPVKFYPMVRARLVSINHVKVSADNYKGERAKHMITREFNLSWAQSPQKDNKIVSGKWWNKNDFGKPLLSFEKNLADTLHIKLGDTLGFDINGVLTSFRVTSLRSVDWNTFNVNFFTVVPPGVLNSDPASWVTSLYLNDAHKKLLAPFVRQFSNVTVIDVDTIMKRLRNIMDRVIQAVESIFIFTLFAGLLVLYAVIQANQDIRRHESAICRTLGATRSLLLRSLIAEFGLLGALSGLFGGVAANIVAYLLARYAFDFEFHFDPLVVLVGLVSGVVIIGICGVAGAYNILRQPPVLTLKQAG